jgi:thiol-disulfide isomerase/thioredoxin
MLALATIASLSLRVGPALAQPDSRARGSVDGGAANGSGRAQASGSLRVQSEPRSLPPLHDGSELGAMLPVLARGRPLVLHFCATWCASCRAEFVKLRKLLVGLEARGVSVELIWIDTAQTRAAIPKMTTRYRLRGIPALLLDAPDPAPIASALHAPGWDGTLPATFVYDAHQASLASFIGAADTGLLGAAIDEALRRSK